MSAELERFRTLFGDHWCLDWFEDAFPGWICTLPPDHPGRHEGRHVRTGELFASWARKEQP